MTRVNQPGNKLQVESLRKRVLTGLHDDFILEANFEIDGGERAVLMGQSGSGKTTLLRCLAGLENLQVSGKVVLNGRDITDLPAEKRRVGVVFQQPALFPSLSVLENAIFGLKTHGVSAQEAEAQGLSWLEKVGLKSRAFSGISKLSGGEAQRVAFVRALIWKPELLLLDEPFSALDAGLRELLRSELLELHRLWPVPLLLVSHDFQDAERIASFRLEIRMSEGGRLRSILRS